MGKKVQLTISEPKTDVIGRELQVGNSVAFSMGKNYMIVGVIDAFTKKMVRVNYKKSYRVQSTLQYPENCVLLEGPALVEYLLKKDS